MCHYQNIWEPTEKKIARSEKQNIFYSGHVGYHAILDFLPSLSCIKTCMLEHVQNCNFTWFTRGL
jgi:hypothetical protein